MEFFVTDDILALRTSLISGLTAEKLKTISSEIITAFRSGDYTALDGYARLADIDPKEGTSRIFSLLMHRYHPDKLAKILKEIDLHSENGNSPALKALSEMYLFHEAPRRSEYHAKEETAGYSDDDFGYSEVWEFDESAAAEDYSEDDSSDDDSEDSLELNFTEAVNLHFYGNLDETVTLSDLKNLDGELDLSDSGITSLRGAENCTLISSLNLSGNSIRSISPLSYCTLLEILHLSGNTIETITPLAALTGLRELDISFNNIDDLTPLLRLDRLEYVNIMGNPLREKSALAALREKGIIIIE
jgi:hypothetical protein